MKKGTGPGGELGPAMRARVGDKLVIPIADCMML